VPTLNALVAYVATPPLNVPVPKLVEPFLNVTVPLAVAGVTVAVNVTLLPFVEGFTEEPRAVSELACVMLAVVVGAVIV
jgi:hypothetical protein